MILCMPIPTIFFSSFPMWGYHSHFIGVKYMTRGPIGRNVVYFLHLRILCFTTTSPLTCVSLSLANDTYIISLASNVVPIFLQLHQEFFALGLSMQPTKCVVCSSQGLDHFISLPPNFLIPNSSFRILDTLVGFRSFVELFVVKTFHEDLGTIHSLLMFVNPGATFAMLLLCYAQHLGYLLRIVFPSHGILQHNVKFDTCTIITLEKLLGVDLLVVLLIIQFVIRPLFLLLWVGLASLLQFKLLPSHFWDVGH